MSMKDVLSEKDEILLMRFVDGECGLLDRRRAEKLHDKCEAARMYVSSLKALRTQSEQELLPESSVSTDLWNRIAQRIEAEQRAELFLGRRAGVVAAEPVPSKFASWFSPTLAKMSGGIAVCAALLLVFSFKQEAEHMVKLAPNQPAGTEVASAAGLHGRPRIIEENSPNVFDVDWVRSDGRINILNSPSEKTSIIWVQRRSPGLINRMRRSPELALVPDATPFIADELNR